MRCIAFALLVVAAPASARAQGAEPRLITPAPAAPPPAESVGYSHRGQLEVSLRVALGLRAIATYDDTTYCGDTDPSAPNMFAPVCTGRAPLSLDFELGYGVARRVDLIAELRVGLEPDFGASPGSSGPHLFHLAPGARFFFNDVGRAKLFTTAQLVFDFSGYHDPAGDRRNADFGVRNLDGLWIDLDRAYGFYAFVGDTLTAARWMRFELEAGVGIQGRYR